MTSSEKVCKICKERMIPLSRLEKDLGFSNAYIKRIKTDFPTERLEMIAKYLDVPVESLVSDEINNARILGLRKDSTVKAGESEYHISLTGKDVIDLIMNAKGKGSFDPELPEIMVEIENDSDLKALVKQYVFLDPKTKKRLARYAELLMKGEL